MTSKWLIAAPALLLAAAAGAKLPPLSDEAKAKAAEAAARTAHGDKVAAYKLCQAQDRVAAEYLAAQKAAGHAASAPPVATPSCTDPGPFVYAPAASAPPLEAAGAHSRPETATQPHNSAVPNAAQQGKKP